MDRYGFGQVALDDAGSPTAFCYWWSLVWQIKPSHLSGKSFLKLRLLVWIKILYGLKQNARKSQCVSGCLTIHCSFMIWIHLFILRYFNELLNITKFALFRNLNKSRKWQLKFEILVWTSKRCIEVTSICIISFKISAKKMRNVKSEAIYPTLSYAY